MNEAEWTGDDLIEALKRCHRTDAPIYFDAAGGDLNLASVETNGGQIRFTFNDITAAALRDALGDAINELTQIAEGDTQPDRDLIERLQAVLDASGG